MKAHLQRDAMKAFSSLVSTHRSRNEPSNVQQGDCRDGDKLLCNTLYPRRDDVMGAKGFQEFGFWVIFLPIFLKLLNLCIFSSLSTSIPKKYFNKPMSVISNSSFILLHSNLSPSLPFPVPHIGGLIPWPVGRDKTWKYFHCIPLKMSFHCPENISLQKTLKIALFPLVWFHSSTLTPRGKILQRGRANWRSVIEPNPRQPY